MAMGSSVYKDGFGGLGGINLLELLPLSHEKSQAMASTRVAFYPTCWRPDRVGK